MQHHHCSALLANKYVLFRVSDSSQSNDILAKIHYFNAVLAWKFTFCFDIKFLRPGNKCNMYVLCRVSDSSQSNVILAKIYYFNAVLAGKITYCFDKKFSHPLLLASTYVLCRVSIFSQIDVIPAFLSDEVKVLSFLHQLGLNYYWKKFHLAFVLRKFHIFMYFYFFFNHSQIC